MKEEFNGIPVLEVRGKGLAEAYEKAIIKLYEEGCDIPTQYDKSGDPLSRDATMRIIVEYPKSEPRIHKAFPGGIEDLQEYMMEFVDGIKDSWTRDPTDPRDTRWEYTYHGRICNREIPVTETMKYVASMSEEEKTELNKRGEKVLLDMPWAKLKQKKIKNKLEEVVSINQAEACTDMLTKNPYTRRAQAITWQPEEDLVAYDPACLQSIWLRMSKGNDGIYRLNTNIRMRSNDAWGGAFMNMFAFIFFQEDVAGKISKNIGEPVELGRYVHHVDSFQIYGKDLETFEQRLYNKLERTTFEDRTYRYDDPLIKEIMEEAIPKILEKVAKQSEKYKARK